MLDGSSFVRFNRGNSGKQFIEHRLTSVLRFAQFPRRCHQLQCRPSGMKYCRNANQQNDRREEYLQQRETVSSTSRMQMTGFGKGSTHGENSIVASLVICQCCQVCLCCYTVFAVKMVFCSLTRNTLNFAEQHGNTNSALFRERLCIPRQKVQFLSVCSTTTHFPFFLPHRE